MSGDLTARDVIAHEVHLQVPTLHHGPIGTEFVADAVLAALADAGWRLVRDEQWEWGCRYSDGEVDEASWADATLLVAFHESRTLVRRHPAGEWEVAPNV